MWLARSQGDIIPSFRLLYTSLVKEYGVALPGTKKRDSEESQFLESGLTGK
jgi:hypothetical protein